MTPQATQKFLRPLHRPDQRIAVRRKRERSIDDLADAGLAQRRKVLERDFQARRDALQIVGQQVLAEVPRRRLRGPRHAGALVGTDQHAAALLAQVDLALEIDAVQLLLLPASSGRSSVIRY